jgi:hypothetical protein
VMGIIEDLKGIAADLGKLATGQTARDNS